MKKAVVVYDSKYGNTKLVAEKIAEGMKAGGGINATISSVSDVNINKIPEYDIIMIGSPNHMGGPVGTVKKFIDGLKDLQLNDKNFAVFDTYLGKDFEKATMKMDKRIKKKVPGAKPDIPYLSIRVQGMKGPLEDGELAKCKEFGVKVVKLMRK